MNAGRESLTVASAAARLVAGEALALPTETVYGLAADADNPRAVAQIFALKNRPVNHPLITHIAADANIAHWVDAARMTESMWQMTRDLMAAFFPGPLTLVLPKHPNVDGCVTGGQDTIALRSPNHALFQDVLQLMAKLKSVDRVGIAAPSANKFGRVSPTRAEHVWEEFDGAVAVLDGDASVIGIESTIVDLSSGVPKLLRYGHITGAEIERACGVAVLEANQLAEGQAPRVSGSLTAHYAPTTPMIWLSTLMQQPSSEPITSTESTAQGDALKDAVLLHHSAQIDTTPFRSSVCLSTDPQAYARGLYHSLRQLDELNASCIVLEDLPTESAWHAVRDRLSRAVVGSNLGRTQATVGSTHPN